MIQRASIRGGILAFALFAVAAGLPGTAAAEILLQGTSARFDWQPAPGPVEFYEVYVSRSSRAGRYELEQTVLGGATSAVIDAEIGEVVRVRIRAGNNKVLGPMSPPSDMVRLGLAPEVPIVGTPGVRNGRAAGSDTGQVFYADPQSTEVWRYSATDPTETPVLIGNESDVRWRLVASGDFDGDGAADLFWHHDDGATRIWYLDVSGYQEEVGPSSPGIDWQVETTGDFDANGQDDVFWHDPAGPTLAWLRAGVDFGVVYFPAMPSDIWEMVAAGDFDGDGFDDLFWRHRMSTDTTAWFTRNDPNSGLYARVRTFEKRSMLWEVYETWDEDGDGDDDIHWRLRNSHDEAEWWLMEGDTIRVR